MEEKTKLITANDAAKILGITRQGVRYLVKNGKIKPVDNIESRYKFFDVEDIYRYRDNR